MTRRNGSKPHGCFTLTSSCLHSLIYSIKVKPSEPAVRRPEGKEKRSTSYKERSVIFSEGCIENLLSLWNCFMEERSRMCSVLRLSDDNVLTFKKCSLF